MLSTGDRLERAASPVVVPRRRVLAGIAGLPLALALAGCTTRVPQSPPSSSAPSTGGGETSTRPPSTEPPVVDAPALVAAATDALALLAAYEATVSQHPALGPVLAPYAADHDTHLEALAERITLPTSAPFPPLPTTAPTTTGPTSGAPAGPTNTAPPVPTDPAGARAAVVQAEIVTGEAARDAARQARDGEVARLLASIGASRAVHALLLGAPA